MIEQTKTMDRLKTNLEAAKQRLETAEKSLKANLDNDFWFQEYNLATHEIKCYAKLIRITEKASFEKALNNILQIILGIDYEEKGSCPIANIKLELKSLAYTRVYRTFQQN